MSKEPEMCVVDVGKLESNGDFPCPKCGATISPDDESERVYQVIDTVTKPKELKEELKEMTIKCLLCNTKMKITFPEDESHESK